MFFHDTGKRAKEVTVGPVSAEKEHDCFEIALQSVIEYAIARLPPPNVLRIIPKTLLAGARVLTKRCHEHHHTVKNIIFFLGVFVLFPVKISKCS